MIIIPRDDTISLAERDYYTCTGGYCYYSSWYSWQRWVVLGVLLIITTILIFSCACLSARRRRHRGVQPFYGTAWAAPPPAYDVHNIGTTGPQYGGHTGTGYNTGQQYAAHGHTSPPGYTPQSNTGYYGQQGGATGGHEMGGVGASGGFDHPRSPPPVHVSKY